MFAILQRQIDETQEGDHGQALGELIEELAAAARHDAVEEFAREPPQVAFEALHDGRAERRATVPLAGACVAADRIRAVRVAVLRGCGGIVMLRYENRA